MVWLRLARARLFARLVVAMSACALSLVLPAAARAGLSWSTATIDSRAQSNGLAAIACPAANECVSVDRQGTAVTFNPQAPQSPFSTVVSAHPLTAVACPTTSQCSAIETSGREVTFTPGAGGVSSQAVVDTQGTPLALACASASACTAVDDSGGEATFNPQSPRTASPVPLEPGHALPAVSCPLATECTALDDSGNELTFDPDSPGTANVITIDFSPAVGLTCPTSDQCTGIDTVGQQVTFFPLSRFSLSPQSIDGAARLTAISCRTATGCVAVDAAGRALEGDPRGTGAWLAEPVASGPLPAVACPSATECVSIDAAGDAFTGTSGPLPATPQPLGPPSISGTPEQTMTLTASPGPWSNAPTSYTYQWERCTNTGRRCKAIRGAVGPTHIVTAGDVGRRLRVVVTAYNISGGGSAEQSGPTKPARPLVSLAIKQGSLTGVASGTPRLSLKLAVATGQQPLKTVTVSLPAGVSVASARAAVIRVLGTRRHLRFRTRAHGRKLEVICLSRTSGLRISVPASAIRVNATLARHVRSDRLRSVRVGLLVTARYGGKTRDRLELPTR